MSVSALMGATIPDGLFHRAIVESGPPYSYSVEQASERAERLAAFLDIPMSRQAWEAVPTGELVRAATEVGRVGADDPDSGLLFLPVVDGGLLEAPPEDEVASGSASGIPLLIGTTRDESAFFTVGNAVLNDLDDEGLRRWTSRVTSDPASADELIAAIRVARLSRGEPVTNRDLWVALATDYVFRWPTIRFADAHAAAADPGVGTYCYLFTWSSPAFGGVLGSCHALDIPFVFGTVHNPTVQIFAGGGEDAFALSDIMRADWSGFARSGVPGPPGRTGPATDWGPWEATRRPTTVFGPWPDSDGLRHHVDGPRDEELRALARAIPERSPTPG
jgi:carboxylesterase type B